jgi:hypothetical protein
MGYSIKGDVRSARCGGGAVGPGAGAGAVRCGAGAGGERQSRRTIASGRSGSKTVHRPTYKSRSDDKTGVGWQIGGWDRCGDYDSTQGGSGLVQVAES